MNKEKVVKELMEDMERAKRNYSRGIFTHAQQAAVIRITVYKLAEIFPAKQIPRYIYAYNLTGGAGIIEDAKEIIAEME